LDLAFASQSRLTCLMLLVPNQRLNSILTGKSGHGSSSMLPDPPNEIIRHPCVQCSVSSARQDVSIEAHCTWLLGPRFRGDERRVHRAFLAKRNQRGVLAKRTQRGIWQQNQCARSSPVSRLSDLAQDLGGVLAEPRGRARRSHWLAADHDRGTHAGNFSVLGG